ncbi:MAG: glycoside hydrolase family 88 protein [Planctomycetota bacterium]
MDTYDIANRAFDSHLDQHSMLDYPAILSLHGLSRLAVVAEDEGMIKKGRRHLLPFVQGRRKVTSHNFQNYRCGGNGTAFLLWKRYLEEAKEPVTRYAEQLMHDAPRSPESVFCMPRGPHKGAIWIDVAFAVTPFLLFAGLALECEEYIEEACNQTLTMVDIFRDHDTGLLHQCRDFRGPGLLSEDHWSRGNGWGIFALAELASGLPQAHPRRAEVESCFADLLNACLVHQNDEGLWYQEMTMPESYVETSGSGLILYALGVALEEEAVSKERKTQFVRGLRGYVDYITPQGDVFHTCRGCLCPGEGRKIDYAARAPVRNDQHAFGPVILAFGQAHNLGIEQLD